MLKFSRKVVSWILPPLYFLVRSSVRRLGVGMIFQVPSMFLLLVGCKREGDKPNVVFWSGTPSKINSILKSASNTLHFLSDHAISMASFSNTVLALVMNPVWNHMKQVNSSRGGIVSLSYSTKRTSPVKSMFTSKSRNLSVFFMLSGVKEASEEVNARELGPPLWLLALWSGPGFSSDEKTRFPLCSRVIHGSQPPSVSI
mmetsp:Transcript_77694/g.126015  ORF Transcript_77694/g.126015 Transcript_77694/m.126015 type:complete len:200 (-) Transcript_77694:1924-2523(-)